MNTRLTIGIITVIAILLGVFVFINLAGGNVGSFFSPLFSKSGTITIDGHTFSVLLAKTEKEKQTGLSGKTTLAQNQGMLFLFDPADYYGFWMKGMKFSIDIIYIHNKKIVTIFQNLPFPQNPNANLQVYTPSEPSDTVLEVNAGTAQKDNFAIGDTVKTAL